MYRILTATVRETTTELVETAVQAGVPVKSLSVQNTTLDDVFSSITPDVSCVDDCQSVMAVILPASISAMRALTNSSAN